MIYLKEINIYFFLIIKVVELMGSTITQISCGRQHTLAFVPSRGRIYSFGLGGAGQLGGRKAINSSTPQVVLGPWISPSGTTVVPCDKYFVIYRIFAGGDHCFATVQGQNLKGEYDCREYPVDTQILTLSYAYLNKCLKIGPKHPIDHEMLSYLETVFKSLSCFNGSFLLENGEHYYCTSKHHGVDIQAAEKTFSLIGRFENNTIKDIVSVSRAVVTVNYQCW